MIARDGRGGGYGPILKARKMISIKKALFVFAAAVGIAASFSSTAAVRAWIPSDSCDYILNSCYQGNQESCERWFHQCQHLGADD